MNFLKRTAGFVAGTVRSVGSTLNVLSVRTLDIPISPVVIDSLSLADVQKWMKQHLLTPDEPVKVAVVRERHGQLWKIFYVVLNQRNKRCTDGDGRLRAHATLVRSITTEMDEIFGARHCILLTPDH